MHAVPTHEKASEHLSESQDAEKWNQVCVQACGAPLMTLLPSGSLDPWQGRYIVDILALAPLHELNGSFSILAAASRFAGPCQNNRDPDKVKLLQQQGTKPSHRRAPNTLSNAFLLALRLAYGPAGCLVV